MSSAYVSTYPITPSDICVPVTSEYTDTVFKVNEAWIFGAFFLGLILGIAVTALLTPCCLRNLAKKKLQDEQELLEEKDAYSVGGGGRNDVIYAYNTKVKSKKKTKLILKGREDEDEDMEPGSRDKDDEATKTVDPALSHGISDILVQVSVEEAEAEMMKQDVDRVDKVTRDHGREKDDMFLKMLKKQLMKTKMPDTTLADIINDVKEDMRNKVKIFQDEKSEVAEELKKQHSKDKDTQTLETELDKLDAALDNKFNRLHEDERHYIRTQLANRTDLTDDQIEELMGRLLKDMANLEKKLGDDWNRQNRLLEERLAKRRQILEFRKLQDQQAKDELKDHVLQLEETTERLVNQHDGGLKQADRDQILNEYRQDLHRLNLLHDKETDRQMLDLAEKLRLKRVKRMHQLNDKHERDKAMFMERVDRGIDTGDFVQGYHDLMQQHRKEVEVAETEVDQRELGEVDHLKQRRMADKAQQIETRTEDVSHQLKLRGANEYDAEKIIQNHKDRMEALNEQRLQERNRMAAKLREKWERRMNQLDEEEQQLQQDQETRAEQQTSTVNRVLSTSIELTDDAKKRILKEHEHNMHVLNNQLEKSKTKQQRNIELRLNQRRAKMAELRRQKEEALLNKAKASKEERERLERQLEEEIALEEKKIEDERQMALNALKRRLGVETEEALKQQEMELGALIGRLEIGSARRQAVLQKQDTLIQNLEDQLENKLSKGGVQLSGTDQLIQQHYNQVEHLNNKLQASREQQEQIIREKIQAKRLQREHDLKEQIVEEKSLSRRNSSLRRRGAGKASDVLNQMFMAQRHTRQIEELEQEMKVELERSKEELNRQLESELQDELQEHKRQLLSQLASQSRLSKGELQDAVDAAVSETGGNKKAAKKLARDLQQNLERARTEMDQYSDENDTRPGSRAARPSSGVDGRPKSGIRKKKKRGSVAPAQDAWNAENDDDDF